MIVKEYRVLIPLEVEEFRKGQLYAVSEASRMETGGGEGVEVLKQEDFTSDSVLKGATITGIYTHKIYRLKSKVPWVFQKMLPDAATELHEECWNAYPYSKTVITNPGYMKKDFLIQIETLHKQDDGSHPDALQCGVEDREVIHLDIYSDQHLLPSDTTETTDPQTFSSQVTGRGPLSPDWHTSSSTHPVMCAYKLVSVNFKWLGVGGRVERAIHRQYPRMFTKFHRDAYCWLDAWFGMSMDEIRQFEMETAEQLKNALENGEKRGSTMEDVDERKSVKA